MGQHFDIVRKVLDENHHQDLSRSQKLRQKRLEHFTVPKRITHTTCQIKDDKDPTILKTVHRDHLVENHPKEETLTPLIDESVPMDRPHDDLYKKFMEQRIQKLNNPEQSGMEDSLPFPIEPFSTAPVTLPQKGVSNTSSYSRVNSLHVQSPALALTPDDSQPCFIPSTSRMKPHNGPLTPIH